MKVTLSTVGKFHSFHLAEQLFKNNILKTIYTGYPKFKLKETGVPKDNIKSYPWFRGVYMYYSKFLNKHPMLKRELSWWSHEYLDIYSKNTLDECDIFMALSGVGQHTGKLQKSRGGVYICDRGSSHILYQDDILREEYDNFGISYNEIDKRIIDKETIEYDTSDAITVPSEFVLESFVKMGVSRDKLYKLPYGVSLNVFKKIDEAKYDEEFNVIFVGGDSIRKGIYYLIDAFNKLDHENKKLTIIGSVKKSDLVSFNKLDFKNISYKGTVPNIELYKYLNQANIFVLPSIEEGLSLVMAEAMACGCPVIATSNTGASDLYTDKKEGFIVPIRSSDAIAEKLQLLADNHDLRNAMSKAALKKVQLLGGWDSYGNSAIKLFDELLSN